MNVLVTGGAGYIGSHAVKELLENGHKVFVLDDLSHGHFQAIDHRATFIKGSTADFEFLCQNMKQNRHPDFDRTARIDGTTGLTIHDLEQTELVQNSEEREKLLFKALRELVK